MEGLLRLLLLKLLELLLLLLLLLELCLCLLLLKLLRLLLGGLRRGEEISLSAIDRRGRGCRLLLEDALHRLRLWLLPLASKGIARCLLLRRRRLLLVHLLRRLWRELLCPRVTGGRWRLCCEGRLCVLLRLNLRLLWRKLRLLHLLRLLLEERIVLQRLRTGISSGCRPLLTTVSH